MKELREELEEIKRLAEGLKSEVENIRMTDWEHGVHVAKYSLTVVSRELEEWKQQASTRQRHQN